MTAFCLDLSRTFRLPDGETDSPHQAPGLQLFPVICPYHEMILYDMIPLCVDGVVKWKQLAIAYFSYYSMFITPFPVFGAPNTVIPNPQFASFLFNSPSPLFSIVGIINCIMSYVVFVVVRCLCRRYHYHSCYIAPVSGRHFFFWNLISRQYNNGLINIFLLHHTRFPQTNCTQILA